MTVFHRYLSKPSIDLVVTLLLWTYFIFGYFLLFFPIYLAAFLLAGNREYAFQKLNHIFFKVFFLLARVTIPQLELRVSDEVLNFRSSVIVCNHLSYLDPILLISLFERHKTIVKGAFFNVPVFGWVLKTAGHLPSSPGAEHREFMIKNLEGMREYLLSGGNLFIFPEGHRSRDGNLGPFRKGAFSIAKRCNAPMRVLRIRNTALLFRPGRFLFNTCVKNTIELEMIGSFEPVDDSASFSISERMEQVRSLYMSRLSGDAMGDEEPS